MNKRKIFLLLAYLAAVFLAAWLLWAGYAYWRDNHARIDFPKIDRRPVARDWQVKPLSEIPHFNPRSTQPFQVDLRVRDLSALDLRSALPDLMYATFDTATVWPDAAKMPEEFDYQHIMELGKNPGLGIRRLHAQGITGRGVGIAIIDQTMGLDHPEYAARLRLYEETSDVLWPGNQPQMHGSAVSSIAIGKTGGVAPEADLYFIATNNGFGLMKWILYRLTAKVRDSSSVDFTMLARCIRRVMVINRQLPADRKIRVISMAIGWRPQSNGYDEITAATKEAKASGLLVVSSSIEQVHGFRFHGLGRSPLADPDDFESYEPGLWWAEDYYHQPDRHDRLLVPMDSRATAGFASNAPYTFYRQGGWSWAIPYIAGVYALAVQVKPAITPDEFWSVALKTGRTIELKHDGQRIAFGPIVDPGALVRTLSGQVRQAH